jgi:spore coat protein U-like protein
MRFSGFLKSSRIATALGCLVLGLAPTPGLPATATTTFAVTANIAATCLISAGTLDFATYTGVQVDSTSTISVTCTNTTGYNVGLNAGAASGATVTTRSMTGPGNALLNYALYSESTRTTNWGNTVGTDTKSGSGSGSAQAITVYGRLAASQYPAPGAYSDTITATITY